MFILIDEKKKLSTQPKDKTDKQINKQTNHTIKDENLCGIYKQGLHESLIPNISDAICNR